MWNIKCMRMFNFVWMFLSDEVLLKRFRMLNIRGDDASKRKRSSFMNSKNASEVAGWIYALFWVVYFWLPPAISCESAGMQCWNEDILACSCDSTSSCESAGVQCWNDDVLASSVRLPAPVRVPLGWVFPGMPHIGMDKLIVFQYECRMQSVYFASYRLHRVSSSVSIWNELRRYFIDDFLWLQCGRNQAIHLGRPERTRACERLPYRRTANGWPLLTLPGPREC